MRLRTRIGLGLAGLALSIFAIGCSTATEDYVAGETPCVEDEVYNTITGECIHIEVAEATELEFNDGCWTNAECPIQNGWTLQDWTDVALMLAATDSVAAGCITDAVMLRYTPAEFVALDDDEFGPLGASIGADECLSAILEAVE